MFDNDFALPFMYFCQACNGFISSLETTISEEKKYRIELSKEEIDYNDKEVKLNLRIYDMKYDRSFDKYFERDMRSNNQNYLSINIKVKKEHYEAVIKHFIESFYANHAVTHASVDTLGSRIAVHNTHFELCIKYTAKDKEWAENLKISFNERLRRDSNNSNYYNPNCRIRKIKQK